LSTPSENNSKGMIDSSSISSASSTHQNKINVSMENLIMLRRFFSVKIVTRAFSIVKNFSFNFNSNQIDFLNLLMRWWKGSALKTWALPSAISQPCTIPGDPHSVNSMMFQFLIDFRSISKSPLSATNLPISVRSGISRDKVRKKSKGPRGLSDGPVA
jgi:hypothetical protein